MTKAHSSHPSLHFKKAGDYWSVRVGIQYRAPAVEDKGDLIWFWIGPQNGRTVSFIFPVRGAIKYASH